MKIDELAEQTGVPARTIRRYIAKNLVRPPVGKTKAARYNLSHVDDVREVKELLAKDGSLERVAQTIKERRRVRPERSETDSQRRMALPIATPYALHISDGVMLVFYRDEKLPALDREEAVVYGVRGVLSRSARKRPERPSGPASQ